MHKGVYSSAVDKQALSYSSLWEVQSPLHQSVLTCIISFFIVRKGDVKPEAGDISALLADIRKGSKLQRTHRNVSETKILPKTTTETAKTVDQSSCILAATAEPSFK